MSTFKLVVAYQTLVLLGLWAMVRWKDIRLTLTGVLCLYGYSLAWFIPGALLFIFTPCPIKLLIGLPYFLLSFLLFERYLV
mmetsp:Transcript_82706/g.145880  ORF Transcript_82706/g.145880 Transcript_82706/m.145880 type:complete len:81 (+) Transcript_82706:2-244(+)